jgi:uncharacterized membrane-anchored protein
MSRSEYQRIADVAVRGPARKGKRTKDLIKRLERGDIAIIDHQDLDRVAADGLVERQVAAVINAAPCISGRYPNGGPIRIVRAGIPLLDLAGPDLFERIEEGADLSIDADGRLLLDGVEVGSGNLLDEAWVLDAMEDARVAIGNELESFAVNTLEYIEKEARLTFEPIVLPERMHTDFRGRHALVVVRGLDYREDLRALKPYIDEYHPVLVAVDGGADALLEMKLKPDLIIGDFDSVTPRAMHLDCEKFHHVHPDGRAPGREELAAAGLKPGQDYEEFVVEGTSEDAAMLLAYEAGAKLIVAVGTHATMVEFLDKGRAGMSSTFLTRLRLGPVLVDAKGVSNLYEGRVRRRDVLALVMAALFAMVVISIVAEPIHVYLDGIWLRLKDFWYSLTDRI